MPVKVCAMGSHSGFGCTSTHRNRMLGLCAAFRILAARPPAAPLPPVLRASDSYAFTAAAPKVLFSSTKGSKFCAVQLSVDRSLLRRQYSVLADAGAPEPVDATAPLVASDVARSCAKRRSNSSILMSSTFRFSPLVSALAFVYLLPPLDSPSVPLSVLGVVDTLASPVCRASSVCSPLLRFFFCFFFLVFELPFAGADSVSLSCSFPSSCSRSSSSEFKLSWRSVPYRDL